jgi:TatD DNase family protein
LLREWYNPEAPLKGGFLLFLQPAIRIIHMQLIDTHTHLYLPEFDHDRDDVVKRAVENNVVGLLMPNIDISSVDKMISCEKRYGRICYSMIGLHPTSVKKDYADQLDILEEKVTQNIFVAVGEIGIDLYWDKTFIKEQITAFKKQIELSLSLEIPAVIHSRESFPEVFDALKDFKGTKLKGVFHAFTGDISIAGKAVSMGFKLGIGGIVTFKNSGLDSVVKEIGLENIILETDSPYLAPAPFRGKRNESSYLALINNKIAEILNIDPEKSAEVTYSNSSELFNLPQ